MYTYQTAFWYYVSHLFRANVLQVSLYKSISINKAHRMLMYCMPFGNLTISIYVDCVPFVWKKIQRNPIRWKNQMGKYNTLENPPVTADRLRRDTSGSWNQSVRRLKMVTSNWLSEQWHDKHFFINISSIKWIRLTDCLPACFTWRPTTLFNASVNYNNILLIYFNFIVLTFALLWPTEVKRRSTTYNTIHMFDLWNYYLVFVGRWLIHNTQRKNTSRMSAHSAIFINQERYQSKWHHFLAVALKVFQNSRLAFSKFQNQLWHICKQTERTQRNRQRKMTRFYSVSSVQVIT